MFMSRVQQGRRPIYGGTEKFQTDPRWRNYILFNEYLHGDNGAGLGATTGTNHLGFRCVKSISKKTAVEGIEWSFHRRRKND
jgi:hypothetical protein